MEQYRPEQPKPASEDFQKAPGAAPGPTQGRGHHGHMGKGLHGKMDRLMHLNQPVFFLLWDGKELPGRNGIDKQGKRGDRVQVVPNPASGEHEVNFNLESAGTVTFTLLDYAGKPIKQVYSGDGKVGANTVSLSVTELKSGLYFYQIDSPDGEKSSQVLCELKGLTGPVKKPASMLVRGLFVFLFLVFRANAKNLATFVVFLRKKFEFYFILSQI